MDLKREEQKKMKRNKKKEIFFNFFYYYYHSHHFDQSPCPRYHNLYYPSRMFQRIIVNHKENNTGLETPQPKIKKRKNYKFNIIIIIIKLLTA